MSETVVCVGQQDISKWRGGGGNVGTPKHKSATTTLFEYIPVDSDKEVTVGLVLSGSYARYTLLPPHTSRSPTMRATTMLRNAAQATKPKPMSADHTQYHHEATVNHILANSIDLY